MKKGNAILRDPQLRKLRAIKMLEYKVNNAATNVEIAKAFNVSYDTVERTLSWAKKAQILVELEDKALQELLPAAHEAVKRLLEDTENPVAAAQVALELMKGFMPSMGKKKSDASGGGSSDELSRYINEFRAGEGVLDGQVVGDDDKRTLAAGEASVAPKGLPAPNLEAETGPTFLAELVEGSGEGSHGDSEG